MRPENGAIFNHTTFPRHWKTTYPFPASQRDAAAIPFAAVKWHCHTCADLVWGKDVTYCVHQTKLSPAPHQNLSNSFYSAQIIWLLSWIWATDAMQSVPNLLQVRSGLTLKKKKKSSHLGSHWSTKCLVPFLRLPINGTLEAEQGDILPVPLPSLLHLQRRSVSTS